MDFIMNNKEWKKYEEKVKGLVALAEKCELDIFIAIKINKKEMAISFIENHGLISVTPGKRPGSWVIS